MVEPEDGRTADRVAEEDEGERRPEEEDKVINVAF